MDGQTITKYYSTLCWIKSSYFIWMRFSASANWTGETTSVICVIVDVVSDDRMTHVTSRHVECFGGRVDHLIYGLHGEIKRHKLTNRTKASL